MSMWPARLYSYGLYSYGLYSYGLYSYGLYSYGLYSCGLYSHGLNSYDDALCEHSILDDAGRPIDRFSEIGARITRNVKAPLARCELCKLKAELKPKFDSAARRHALETCWFHYQAVRCPLILGLATQPGISYVFVREFLSVVDPDFVLPAAVPDSQLSVEPAVIKAVRALFTEQYHREYCERYDTHMEADPCSPYGALQWSVDPYNIRADIRAYCKEHNLLSRERKKDWLKLASDPNCKFQDLDDRDEGLPFVFIDLLRVDSVGNPKVEGNFNLDDLYGDTQLEGMRKEAQLMYVCNSLGPERTARRDPAMRVRGDAGKKIAQGHQKPPTARTIWAGLNGIISRGNCGGIQQGWQEGSC